MRCAVGVCVMHAQEMKCIVGHKKELSNVGAPSFLPPLKAECLCNYRGRVTAHTTHSNMRLTAQCLCFIKLLNTLWCSSLVLHLIIYPSFFLLLFYLFLSGISFPPLHFFPLFVFLHLIIFLAACTFAHPCCLLGDCYHATQSSLDWLSSGAGMLCSF